MATEYVMLIRDIPERGMHERTRMKKLGETVGDVEVDESVGQFGGLRTADKTVAEAWVAEGKVVQIREDGEMVGHV